MWVAGGGMKRGSTLGETDDFSYNIVSDPVSVFDLQATILHVLGIDHKKLTFKFQGRDFRLTDVHGDVVTKILLSARAASFESYASLRPGRQACARSPALKPDVGRAKALRYATPTDESALIRALPGTTRRLGSG